MKYLSVKVFLDSNLNFTISAFTCGLANDDNVCKKKKKKKKFCPIWSIIQSIEIMQFQICEGSQMKKYSNLAEQHLVPQV